MHKHIDKFQEKLLTYFRQLILGSAFVKIGNYIDNPNEMNITVTLDKGVTTEPKPLSDILHHANAVAAGTAELFQVRTIAAWNDLLTDVFGSHVAAHFSGHGNYPNLGQLKGQIDFSSNEPILDQIQHSIIADFAFYPYDKRIRIVRKLLKSGTNIDSEFKLLSKHVEIRNSLQHHNGKVTDDLLKNIGSNKLEMLNTEGEKISYKKGELILLSIPDLDRLNSALYKITLKWRSYNADLPT